MGMEVFSFLLVVTMGATRDTSNHSLFKCFCTILDCFNVRVHMFRYVSLPWAFVSVMMLRRSWEVCVLVHKELAIGK